MILSNFPTAQPAPIVGQNGNWWVWDAQTRAYVDTGRPSQGDSAGLSGDIKDALLTLAQKVTYVDEHGQDYYDALYAALYPPAELLSIIASFAQGSHIIYDTDALDTLKPYLTVTGAYDDGSSRAITDYTLSGTLAEGTSTITVSFGGKTTTFNVTVTEYTLDYYLFSLENGQLEPVQASTTGYLAGNARYGKIVLDPALRYKRRSFPTKLVGVKPMMQQGSSPDKDTDTEYYPVPIPRDAVSAVVSITPATQFHGVSIYTYRDGKYIRQQDPGWKQGAFTYTFTAGQYDYITVASKYNSAGTGYPEEPTAVSIQFLTE